VANKYRIGQKVKAKLSLVDWLSSHFCWSYGKLMDNDLSYSKGEKEIGQEDLYTLYVWSRAKLGNKMPTGVVRTYGADEYKNGLKSKAKRKFVWVDFKFNTELGQIVSGHYVSEKDLETVKPRVRKR